MNKKNTNKTSLKKIKDDDYATKYARLSILFKDGEYVYTIPDLLPQPMENILQTVKQFLEFSDEKLEELKRKTK